MPLLDEFGLRRSLLKFDHDAVRPFRVDVAATLAGTGRDHLGLAEQSVAGGAHGRGRELDILDLERDMSETGVTVLKFVRASRARLHVADQLDRAVTMGCKRDIDLCTGHADHALHRRSTLARRRADSKTQHVAQESRNPPKI